MKLVALLVLTPIVALAEQPRVSPPITLSDSDMSRMEEGVLDAWLAYSIARAAWVSEHVSPDASATHSRSFEEELAGRQMLVEIWVGHVKKHPKARDTYLDQMAMVSSAGFLRDYVWTYLGSKNWVNKPEGLRLDEFAPWNETHLPHHRAKTLSVNLVPAK